MPDELEKAIVTRVLVRGKPANPRHPMKRGMGSPNAVRDPVEIPGQKKKRKLTRKQWREEYQKALKADPGFGRLLKRMSPRHAALLVAWTTNGNNLHRAAHQVGYSMTTARKIFSTEAFREARLMVEAFIPEEDREWLEILPEARHTLRTLMKSPDDKVRYLAAKDIADRGEGKAITRIDMQIRDENPSMTDDHLQLAFSIMQQTGKGFAEVRDWMLSHPEEVGAWISQHVHGQEVAVQEAVPRGVVVKAPNRGLLSKLDPNPGPDKGQGEIVQGRAVSGDSSPIVEKKRTWIVDLL